MKELYPVSIIIPAHNEGHFIGGLLESIRHHVNPPPQIIVVDNGSKDNTHSVVEKFDVELITLDSKVYPSVARNAGAQYARHEILVFLDADIEITSSWGAALRKLISTSGVCEQLFIAGSSYHVSKSPGWIEKYWFQPLRSKAKSYINGGNIITNRRTFDLLSGFDEKKETGEDVDFCERAATAGVEIAQDGAWMVHHEGFPKNIGHFVARERWHGKQDFSSLKSIFSSKIAIATIGFVVLHLVLVLQLVMLLFGNLAIEYVCFVCGIILALCLLRVAMDFGKLTVEYCIYSTCISYLYFLGRSLSLLDSAKRLFNLSLGNSKRAA